MKIDAQTIFSSVNFTVQVENLPSLYFRSIFDLTALNTCHIMLRSTVGEFSPSLKSINIQPICSSSSSYFFSTFGSKDPKG